MYHSLLVPLDGFSFGEQALPLALSIARRAGANLHLVHVHVPYDAKYADSLSPFAHAQDVKADERALAYLDGLVQRLPADSGVPVTKVVLEGPGVPEALEQYATTVGIDLVVMTTHGRGPLSRFWLGSVTDELVRMATRPVLVVRPQEEAPAFARELALHHILIPLDGSALAEQVLEPTVALGTLMKTQYTLLRVIGALRVSGLRPPDDSLLGVSESALEAMRSEAEGYLQAVAERMRARALPVQTHVALGSQPAVTILDEAQARGADLIALETHGRHGMRRLIMGSVADKVLRGALTPVLVHRSRIK